MMSRLHAICIHPLYAALFGLVVGLGGQAQAQELVFISWGGAYTKSQMLAFVRPYQKNTGVNIEVFDYTGGLEEIRGQVRSLNIKWDVVDLELTDALRGCKEGLLEPIDVRTLAPAPDGTPAQQDFIDGALTECAVGTMIWSTVVAYDSEAFTEGRKPASLQDFFDIEQFPGKRGMRYTPKANLEWALLANGVARDKVYDVLETEAGLDRAFRVLDSIKPAIVWWRQGEDAVRLLETDQVTMTTAYNGRIYEAVTARNAPFKIIWDYQIWDIDLLGVPRHNLKRDQSMDFISFATATPQLAAQAKHIPYGPVRYSALEQVAPALRAHLPTAPTNFKNAMRINARWWAEHFEPINRRFAAWASRPIQVPKILPR
jgi:putative spermidine/putrescine transport system substrate-binding protein